MHEDQMNGVKKPLRALGPVTGVSGRTEFRNPIVYLVFPRVENIHIPATSACIACRYPGLEPAWFGMAPLLPLSSDGIGLNEIQISIVERGRTDRSGNPYLDSRRFLRSVIRRSRVLCRTVHNGAQPECQPA